MDITVKVATDRPPSIIVRGTLNNADEVVRFVNALVANSDALFDEDITFRVGDEDVVGAKAVTELPRLGRPKDQRAA
jgi:hypothetical protein